MLLERSSFVPVAGTFSKDAKFWGKLPFNAINDASGASVKCNDGKWRLDWVCGLGAQLLGYNQVGFNAYVNLYARQGNGFSLPHEMEYTTAEKLCRILAERVKYWNYANLQVRWVKTGSDACETAIRLARAVSGKWHVFSYGYHGFGDDFVVMTPPAHGVVRDLGGYMHPFEFGDMGSLEDRDDVAAVILEQPIDDPPANFYKDLRTWCDTHKALLIMDEVVTGFRYAVGGASELYDIQPDLICVGKALGNGYPIGGVVGPKEYLSWFARNDPVFVSSTNAGDIASLAAASFVLDNWTDADVKYIHNIGGQLIAGLNSVGWTVIGHAPRSVLQWQKGLLCDYEKAFFIKSMAEMGILMNRPNFPQRRHTMVDVEKTVAAAKRIRREYEGLDETTLRKLFPDEALPVTLFRNR